MNEEVCFASDLEDARRGGGVAGEDDLPSGPGRAEHLLGPHIVSLGKPHHLPCLEASEQRALGHAQTPGGLDVEPPRPRQLNERVPVRGDSMGHREDEDSVVAAVESVAVPKLDELERIGELSEDALETAEEIPEARGTVDGERDLPATERERLQHARQAQIVIGVIVREQDLGQLHQPDRRPEELALGALAAIDQEPLASAPHERRREGPASGRHGA